MFTPHSLSIALLMMITSAICWGSWANTYKGVKNYRFELFYWDYAVGIFLISLILGHTMGSTGHDAASLVNNIHGANTNDVIFAMVGRALFNLANLLLVAAIDMAGLAIAFPISIGIALVSASLPAMRSTRKGMPHSWQRECSARLSRWFWMARPTAASRAPVVRHRGRASSPASSPES